MASKLQFKFLKINSGRIVYLKFFKNQHKTHKTRYHNNLAGHNDPKYKDKFATFTSRPMLQKIILN